MIEFLLAKATMKVTDSRLEYKGSIKLCPKIMTKLGLKEYQKVDVNNKTSGYRITTYILKGKTGDCEINGAAAHLFDPGDVVHINAYGFTDDEKHTPKVYEQRR